MSQERGCALNATATLTGISLGATGLNAVKGLYLTHQLGGLERVVNIGSQVALEAQRLNIEEALVIAAHYPNEMSAILTFGIAAVCGVAAMGSVIGYAYYEANHE